MEVEIRQFAYPYELGTQFRCIEIPDQFRISYQQMLDAGCELQSEILSTGEVSLTITDNDEDVDIEIISKESEIQEAICRLFQRARWNEPRSFEIDSDDDSEYPF